MRSFPTYEGRSQHKLRQSQRLREQQPLTRLSSASHARQPSTLLRIESTRANTTLGNSQRPTPRSDQPPERGEPIVAIDIDTTQPLRRPLELQQLVEAVVAAGSADEAMWDGVQEQRLRPHQGRGALQT